ncbi:MAG: geranylgeranylglycerol-phosphate geranylgeranyltransferase [Bacteroidales bacterium]|jgi:4-hydroxybenzoate polyprenyltransferase|nr:geranylgeranylglycerol-phosphate geranylgeranyltransferase [Bacteroidales bacterium]
MINFLRLVRYKNLLIIILTQYLMRWGIIKPILEIYDFELQFSDLNFFFLVMATVFITAAGYVINDYFDTKTDLVNRPETVIVGRILNRRWAILLHVILNTIGIGLGVYISFYIGIPALSIVFILITGILWFYSTTYKRQFLIGNIIVAFLTALVPLMVILFEIPLLNNEYGLLMKEMQLNFTQIILWVSAFAMFAFLLSMIREIIKDVEDFEGDSAYGRKTMPIILGVLNTKIVIITFILTTLFSLLYINFRFLHDVITLIYFVVVLIFPLLFLIYKVIVAENKKDYRRASNLSKLIMLAGILYSLIANYIIIQNF